MTLHLCILISNGKTLIINVFNKIGECNYQGKLIQ